MSDFKSYLPMNRNIAFLKWTGLVLLCITILSCKKTKTLFQEVPVSKSGIQFINQLNYSDSLTVLDFEYMFNGAGVALLDVNNDGLEAVSYTHLRAHETPE